MGRRADVQRTDRRKSGLEIKVPGTIDLQISVAPASVRRIEHPLYDLGIAARSPEVFHHQRKRSRNHGRSEAGSVYSVTYVALSGRILVRDEAPDRAWRGEALVRPIPRRIPVIRKWTASVGIRGDGACLRIRCGDGKGVSSQLRDVIRAGPLPNRTKALPRCQQSRRE